MKIICLTGGIGSGKSSLLKTLYADLPLQEGEAEIVGHHLSILKNSEIPFLRRKIGVVFQDFQLLSDRSVYDNLAFPLKVRKFQKLMLFNLNLKKNCQLMMYILVLQIMSLG